MVHVLELGHSSPSICLLVLYLAKACVNDKAWCWCGGTLREDGLVLTFVSVHFLKDAFWHSLKAGQLIHLCSVPGHLCGVESGLFL